MLDILLGTDQAGFRRQFAIDASLRLELENIAHPARRGSGRDRGSHKRRTHHARAADAEKPVSPVAARLLLPYWAWVTYATWLNAGFVFLNR